MNFNNKIIFISYNNEKYIYHKYDLFYIKILIFNAKIYLFYIKIKNE